MRTCVIDAQSGIVRNVVDLGVSPPAPLDPVTKSPRYVEDTAAPAGSIWVLSAAGIGWIYRDGAFTNPSPAPERAVVL